MKFKIKIDIAIGELERNLETHARELREAMEVWNGKVMTALEALTDAVSRKGIQASNDELSGLFYRKPIDHRSNYATYLGALKRAKESGQEFIELDENDYECIFADQFQWRVQSSTTNSMYKK